MDVIAFSNESYGRGSLRFRHALTGKLQGPRLACQPTRD